MSTAEFVLDYIRQCHTVTASQLFTAMQQQYDCPIAATREAIAFLCDAGKISPVLGFVKQDIRAVRMGTRRYTLGAANAAAQ